MTHIDLRIAARDWDHSHWQGEYYPDDLPAEWRLPFYANEFRAILLPPQKWLAADSHELEDWLDETPEDFRFYLEIDRPDFEWTEQEGRLQILMPKLGGIVLHPDRVNENLENITSLLKRAVTYGPTVLLLPSGMSPGTKGLALLDTCEVGLCWYPGQPDNAGSYATLSTPPWLATARLAMTWLDEKGGYNPRQWRELIEAGLQSGANGLHERDLVYIDVRGDMSGMQSARVIGDMLLSASADTAE